MATATNIKQRRLLSDLYKEGVEIRFGVDPETGKPKGRIGPFIDEVTGRPIRRDDDAEVAMFIRPPDPVQRDMAMRAGQAKRARAIVKAKRDEDSEEYLTAIAYLADMDQETLIDYVILGDFGSRRADAEREVLAYEEWKDMAQYQDAMRMFAEMEEHERENDPEWAAMLELDRKYANQVASREMELQDAQRDVLRMMQRDQVERKALERRSEMIGNQAYIQEYELHMLFYSVRDPDNIEKLFFETPQEYAAQPEDVHDTVGEALAPFIATQEEAKNWQGAADGSDSSVAPSKPETSASSTPEEPTE